MVEKELESITWDNIRLDQGYISEASGRKFGGTNIKVVSAFIENIVETYTYTTAKEGDAYRVPGGLIKLHKSVSCLGETLKVNVLSHFGINYFDTFKETKDKYPKVAAELKKRVPKDFFEKINVGIIRERKEYKIKVQKQYDTLLQLYTNHGTKTDLKTMKDINELAYCEASTFLDKLEERINKKNNPKNLKLYKALKTIRGQKFITCE